VEDPIFDPWTSEHEVGERADAGGEPESIAEERAPGDERTAPNGHRWTSPSGTRGVPVQRPVPPRRPRAERFDVSDPAEPSERAEPAGSAEDAVAPEVFDVWAAEERAAAGEAPREPAEPAAVGRGWSSAHRSRRLRETVLPRLEWLVRKVEAAGHRTVLDDRLDSAVPSLRFRLTPRPGPLDDRPASEGAVIEIASGSGAPLQIVGRLWLDPLSPSPTQEVRVPAAKLTEAWIDGLLLDFVERALRGG
jgi:hypothetical protein